LANQTLKRGETEGKMVGRLFRASLPNGRYAASRQYKKTTYLPTHQTSNISITTAGIIYNEIDFVVEVGRIFYCFIAALVKIRVAS
jgi:hypothetical protein